jgi:hypothetical protein
MTVVADSGTARCQGAVACREFAMLTAMPQTGLMNARADMLRAMGATPNRQYQTMRT